MPPAIRLDKLSKLYRLGAGAGAPYRTLRESVSESALALWHRWRGSRGAAPTSAAGDTLWALRDVSAAVEPGHVVGVVGRNGAGKSTLLKIMSRITEPTSGRAEIRGRVGSLLEVGTGFHQELTGRENIFLSGAILGMSRREIRRKFDAIVAFADVERFLDTPVKRYSSGMYVRLAFAVAAHLEPEVLLVDEVLAVGDAQFQKKCLGKMEDIAHQGRTVFFVSHHMASVQRLCTHAMLLEQGRLLDYGPKGPILERYLAGGEAAKQAGQWVELDRAPRNGSREAHFRSARYFSPDPARGGQLFPEGPVTFELVIASDRPRSVRSLGVTFQDPGGTKLVNPDTLSLGQTLSLRDGENTLRVCIDKLHLKPGVYQIALWLANPPHVLDHIPSAFSVEVVEGDEEGFGKRPGNDGSVTCDFSVAGV